MLLDQVGFKFAFAVAGDVDFRFAKARFEALYAMSITAVIRLFVAVVVFRVTEFLVQFALQAIFKNVADQFLEKFLNICYGRYIQVLQKRGHLRAAFALFRGTSALCHSKNLQIDALILQRLRGLHNRRDCLHRLDRHRQLLRPRPHRPIRTTPCWRACWKMTLRCTRA